MNRILTTQFATAILLAGLLPASGQPLPFPGDHAVTPVPTGYCEARKSHGRWRITGWCVVRSYHMCAINYAGGGCPTGYFATKRQRLCDTYVDPQYKCN